MPSQPWNLNIHYDALLDRLIPTTATSVLDVGCGDGFLSARLAQRIPRVVGLDSDAPVLDRARARFPDAAAEWICGDLCTEPVGAFDAVVSNATLHHFPDTAAALSRLAALVNPGGRLATVTFVRLSVRDLPWQAYAWAARGVALRSRPKWEHTAPQHWPPPDTFASLRVAARDRLPGARVRRLAYGRVLLIWDRPRT